MRNWILLLLAAAGCSSAPLSTWWSTGPYIAEPPCEQIVADGGAVYALARSLAVWVALDADSATVALLLRSAELATPVLAAETVSPMVLGSLVDLLLPPSSEIARKAAPGLSVLVSGLAASYPVSVGGSLPAATRDGLLWLLEGWLDGLKNPGLP